jgi:hypothetical protein
MSWRFDPFLVEIVWTPPGTLQTELADITFGDSLQSDIEVLMGERTNDTSDIDQGLRVFDGNI